MLGFVVLLQVNYEQAVLMDVSTARSENPIKCEVAASLDSIQRLVEALFEKFKIN